jgi:hypothetical protein
MLLTARLWLQIHAPQQVGEARVGAQGIEVWVHFNQGLRNGLLRAIKPPSLDV